MRNMVDGQTWYIQKILNRLYRTPKGKLDLAQEIDRAIINSRPSEQPFLEEWANFSFLSLQLQYFLLPLYPNRRMLPYMMALANAHIMEQQSSIGFAPSALPEVNNSQIGVSVGYI